MDPKSFGTFEKQAPGLNCSGYYLSSPKNSEDYTHFFQSVAKVIEISCI